MPHAPDGAVISRGVALRPQLIRDPLATLCSRYQSRREKTEYKQVPNKEANTELEEDEDPKMKTVPETTEGYKQINTNKPI